MTKSYHRFWAKSRGDDTCHLLPYHNLDVAAVATRILESDSMLLERVSSLSGLKKSDIALMIQLFLSWHDLGKFSDGFQNQLPKVSQRLGRDLTNHCYILRHDSAGLLLVQRNAGLIHEVQNLFGDFSSDEDCYKLLYPYLNATFGHHGKPTDLQRIGIKSDYFSQSSIEAALDYINDTVKLLGFRRIKLGDDSNWSTLSSNAKLVSWLLAGFATFCDWVGSSSNYFPPCETPMSLQEYWENRALTQARQALSELNILAPRARSFNGINSTCPHIRTPTPLQDLCASVDIPDEPTLFIIEDTTGSGKTEAAIALSHRILAARNAQSVFFALPTMATANGVYERVKEFYNNLFLKEDKASLILSHSKRHLNDSFNNIINQRIFTPEGGDTSIETGEAACAAWLSDSKKKSLLGAFGVGTIDQALIGVLPIKHQSLRLFGLSRSVLILDEVHAYNSCMSQLISTLLEFQAAFGGYAVLLSATLPLDLKNKFVNSFNRGRDSKQLATLSENSYPSLDIASSSTISRLTFPTRDTVKRRVDVTYTSSKPEVIQEIKKQLSNGRCVCWIRNTIHDAIEAFKEFAANYPEDRITLFHSRFCFGHRQQIENRVLQKFGKNGRGVDRNGQLLIATQVVEQSLDLDFDFMVTDLAPVDLIIQRAGRLRRHTRDEMGNLQFGIDKRLSLPLFVLGPAIVDEPHQNWYRDFSEKANYVYKHTGQLFLTAQILAKKGFIDAPDSFRELIEHVYDQSYMERVPPQLRDVELKAEGKESGEKSHAMLNALRLTSGYDLRNSDWRADIPTRLGEGQNSVILLYYDKGRLIPLLGENEWEASEINLPKRFSPPSDDFYESAESESLRLLIDEPKNRWRKFLIVKGQDDSFEGIVLEKGEKTVKFVYHTTLGFKEQYDL